MKIIEIGTNNRTNLIAQKIDKKKPSTQKTDEMKKALKSLPQETQDFLIALVGDVSEIKKRLGI